MLGDIKHLKQKAQEMASKISKDFGMRGSGQIAAVRLLVLISAGVILIAFALPFLRLVHLGS
jgi:hypothetical protein